VFIILFFLIVMNIRVLHAQESGPQSVLDETRLYALRQSPLYIELMQQCPRGPIDPTNSRPSRKKFLLKVGRKSFENITSVPFSSTATAELFSNDLLSPFTKAILYSDSGQLAMHDCFGSDFTGQMDFVSDIIGADGGGKVVGGLSFYGIGRLLGTGVGIATRFSSNVGGILKVALYQAGISYGWTQLKNGAQILFPSEQHQKFVNVQTEQDISTEREQNKRMAGAMLVMVETKIRQLKSIPSRSPEEIGQLERLEQIRLGLQQRYGLGTSDN
jgi:hypothetical protein